MPRKINRIHDKFFKKILKDVALAKDFFASFLDKQVLELIDLETIQICDTSFVNHDLRETFADVLFSFQLREGGEELYIAILLEHKSVPDKNTPVQVLYYVAHAYYDQIQNKKDLQIVLPLVYYHGEQEWEYKPLSDLFLHFPKKLRKFIPTHQIEFIDLCRISDKELVTLSNFLLTSALLTQKYSRDSKALLDKIELIFGSINRSRQENLIQAIVVYFMQLTEGEKIELNDIVQPLPPPIKNIFMSIYDSILLEGRQKGRQEGRQQGRQEGIQEGIQRGLVKKAIITISNMLDALEISTDQIAHLAGVDTAMVELVRDKMTSGEWAKHPKNWTDEEWETFFINEVV